MILFLSIDRCSLSIRRPSLKTVSLFKNLTMEIKSAEFLLSNSRVDKCPSNNLPEYAFIGRSNVGKSSLINMLCQRKGLAKISGKPGKTRLINHFIINKEWYLVDLPGYGYAKISKTEREKLRKIIHSYINKRLQMICLFVLIDCRHPAQETDLEFLELLGINGVPFAIIFTKADKLTESQLADNLEKYQEKLLETWEFLPNYFVTSSSTGQGRDELLNYIDELNKKAKEST